MSKLCRQAGLPPPEFEQRGSQFVLTIWLDQLTEKKLAGLDLNERQKKAITEIKVKGYLSNNEYQTFLDCPRRTAARDLDELVHKGIFQRVGAGRGAHYILVEKRAKNVPNGPWVDKPNAG